MLSTGITVLDGRLGGLVPGRYYIVGGSSGAGKSSMALHFIGAGLEAGERCAILTQDDPADLLAQAEYLGYDMRAAAEADQLVVLQYRLDFSHNYTRAADPGQLLSELEGQFGGEQPARFVVDSILPFLDQSSGGYEPMAGLTHLLDRLSSTIYLLVPGEVNESQYWSTFERIRAGAAGIFHLSVEKGRVRELAIRKLRQSATSTEPFRFVIRAGVGIVAQGESSRTLTDLPPELRRRAVVLNLAAKLPAEMVAGLELDYEVRTYDSVESSFAELSGGDFGVLIMVVEPRNPRAVFNLTRELRKAGNGVPILFYSSSEDLRASTRTKGLRAGGDDFLTDDMSLQEFIQRVEVARIRGHRPPSDDRVPDSTFVQPTDDTGAALPVEEQELRRVISFQVEQSGYAFFALVFLRPPHYGTEETWRILCDDLRVREGDLVGTTKDGRVVVYLHDIGRRHVKELLARIIQAHPELAGVRDVEVYSFPADRSDIEHWLRSTGVEEEAKVEAGR